jgi:hypothetical protein
VTVGALTRAPDVAAALGSAAAQGTINVKAKASRAKIGIILRMLPRSLQIFALCLCLGACSLLAPKFNRPNVTVIGIELRGGIPLQQNFAVKLNVGGEQIASGTSDRAVVIPAFGESEFDMTITANLALAFLKLADWANQHADSIDYDLSGAASIDLPFLRNLPFHQTGTFKLPLGK